MNRREFLTKAALATLILNASPFAGIFASGGPAGYFKLKDNIDVGDLEKISPALQGKADSLFSWLKEKGWLDYMKGLGLSSSLDLKTLTTGIDKTILSKLKQQHGFEDFGGNKLIEPGCPAFSLLYHILANPRVRPSGFSADQYPELGQIDVLEDYVYALMKWESYKKSYGISDDSDLVLTVFAYEYRTAFKTPHHQYADMVFSRTGIGRVGNMPCRYDKENRCYTNNPSGKPEDKNIAVTPARYGLFIAKKIRYADKDLSAMEMSRDKEEDKHYLNHGNGSEVLLPVRKLFQDDLLIDMQPVNFSEYHESTKISRLTGNESLIRKSTDLVSSESRNSSFLLYSKNEKLIWPLRDAKQQIINFTAPHNTNNSNRYFTTYYSDKIAANVEDIEILKEQGKHRSPNNYEYPRNYPMYVNLSHDATGNNEVVYHGRYNTPAFETEIDAERIVPLFEDKLCDGYVSASVHVLVTNPLKAIVEKGVLNAFSIITAPDFFPQVDDFDFQEFDIAPGSGDSSLFYEGGIASLATCNVPPNPFVYEKDPQALGHSNPKETYTVVISKKRNNPDAAPVDHATINKFKSPAEDKGYFFSSYLPDMCSSVFAPGWDITYSSKDDKSHKDIFLSTQGLGAPFVEDMKLCAAMNGMWPAASPDASRTYQGSVTADQYPDWERNPTAVPLMDDEIGINKEAPAVKEYGQVESYGWDGEQGPFLEVWKEKDAVNRWYINFTDLGRADYVENTIKGILDMSKLRELDSKELHFRMQCLQRCLKTINPDYFPNGKNSLWLVSAERVHWDKSVTGYGIPKNLLTTTNQWATTPRKNMSGDGLLYVFADYTPNEHPGDILWVENKDHTKRRRVCCNTVYVCQVDRNKVSYYKINTKSMDNVYNDSNWQ